MEGWKFWWGVAAFFLGGLAQQLNGWVAYRRQRADRAADEQDALRQRREEFELQHLVEVNQLMRALVEVAVRLGSAGRIGQLESTDEADVVQIEAAIRGLLAAEQAVESQVGFILDDQVRSLVEAALSAVDDASGDLIAPHGRDAATEAVRIVGVGTRPAFEALAARVRTLYAGRGQ